MPASTYVRLKDIPSYLDTKRRITYSFVITMQLASSLIGFLVVPKAQDLYSEFGIYNISSFTLFLLNNYVTICVALFILGLILTQEVVKNYTIEKVPKSLYKTYKPNDMVHFKEIIKTAPVEYLLGAFIFLNFILIFYSIIVPIQEITRLSK